MVNFIKDRKFKKFVQQRWPTGHRITQIVQLLIVEKSCFSVTGKRHREVGILFLARRKLRWSWIYPVPRGPGLTSQWQHWIFVIQPVPVAFSHVLYPLYLQFSSPCLSPSSSSPWLPMHCTDIKPVCINLLTVSALREARAPETESKALIHIQGPGARHSLNLVKLWKNGACINWMRHSINFCKRMHH